MPHLNAAYNLARWLTGNGPDAQDVVQEACLRAFRFFDGYRGGDAKAWLLEIVRNTCRSWQRREKRNADAVPFDETAHTVAGIQTDQEQGMVDAERASALRDCIEALPPEYRETIIMREMEDMPYRRIADVAGVPIGTVMSRLSRARRRLEDCANARKIGKAL